MKGVSGSITVGSQADACLVASGKSLSMSGTAIESSKRPSKVGGFSDNILPGRASYTENPVARSPTPGSPGTAQVPPNGKETS